MKPNTTPPALVLKLGGRALETPDALGELAREIAGLTGERSVVVVHGGGHEVSAWSERLGLTPRFHDGLRVTDESSLAVATAVLAGLCNKQLVAALRHAGVDALGLSACDGDLAALEPHPEAATLGRVGQIGGIRKDLLRHFLATGLVPVVASIGARDGRLWNVNADELAGALAAALAGSQGGADLVFLSDTPGVTVNGELLPEVTGVEIASLLQHPDVRGGMRPKLRAAARALGSSTGAPESPGDDATADEEGTGVSCSITAWQGAGTVRRALAGEAGTRLTSPSMTEVEHG